MRHLLTQSEPTENEDIRNTLIENGIITHPRTKICGNWVNLPPQRDQTSKDPSRSNVEDMNVDSVEKPLLKSTDKSLHTEQDPS